MRRSARDDMLDKCIRPERITQKSSTKVLFSSAAVSEQNDGVILVRFEGDVVMPIDNLDERFDSCGLLRHGSCALGRLARQ